MSQTAKSRIRQIAREVARRHGVRDLAHLIWMSEDDDRVRIRLQCRHLANRDISVEKHSGLTETLSDGGLAALNLQARFSEMFRMILRARAIAALPSGTSSAWAVTVPSIVVEALTRQGYTVAPLADARNYSSWDFVPFDEGSSLMISSAAISNGRFNGRIRLPSDTHEVELIAGIDEDGDCTVSISGLDLPDTMLSVIPGMRLSQVLRHPSLPDDLPHRVIQVHRRQKGGTQIHLRLEPLYTWAGDPPQGADLEWRDLREGTRMPIA